VVLHDRKGSREGLRVVLHDRKDLRDVSQQINQDGMVLAANSLKGGTWRSDE
jgi:hypothetical protein